MNRPGQNKNIPLYYKMSALSQDSFVNEDTSLFVLSNPGPPSFTANVNGILAVTSLINETGKTATLALPGATNSASSETQIYAGSFDVTNTGNNAFGPVFTAPGTIEMSVWTGTASTVAGAFQACAWRAQAIITSFGTGGSSSTPLSFYPSLVGGVAQGVNPLIYKNGSPIAYPTALVGENGTTFQFGLTIPQSVVNAVCQYVITYTTVA